MGMLVCARCLQKAELEIASLEVSEEFSLPHHQGIDADEWLKSARFGVT